MLSLLMDGIKKYFSNPNFYLSIFCILIARFCFAFNAEFGSVNGTPIKLANKLDNRLIANAPFSLCVLDGIPLELCYQVGLRLDQTTFQKVNFFNDFNKEFNYDSTNAEIDVKGNNGAERNVKLKHLEDTYYLPPYKDHTFRVPTEGQLEWLMKNDFIPDEGKGTRYLVRNSVTGKASFKVAIKGVGFNNDTGGKNKLFRLVSEDIPSNCKGTYCSTFRDNSPLYVLFQSKSCPGLRWGWRVRYTTPQNKQKELLYPKNLFKDDQAEVTVQEGGTNISISMFVGGAKWHTRNSVEATDATYVDLSRPDSKYTHNGTTYKKICYKTVGDCGVFASISLVNPCSWKPNGKPYQ